MTGDGLAKLDGVVGAVGSVGDDTVATGPHGSDRHDGLGVVIARLAFSSRTRLKPGESHSRFSAASVDVAPPVAVAAPLRLPASAPLRLPASLSRSCKMALSTRLSCCTGSSSLVLLDRHDLAVVVDGATVATVAAATVGTAGASENSAAMLTERFLGCKPRKTHAQLKQVGPNWLLIILGSYWGHI